jgi:hypothetical protein
MRANMNFVKKTALFLFVLMTVISISNTVSAQNFPEILTGDAFKRIVPTSFYFAGQSAETQLRNAAAAQIGKERFVIAGMVDTSGYSTEIQGIYEGFFITDSPVKIGGKVLKTGAYGFGFTKESINIFDLSSKQIFTAKAMEDSEMKRPRPLMMTISGKGIRLYKGKIYVLISA